MFLAPSFTINSLLGKVLQGEEAHAVQSVTVETSSDLVPPKMTSQATISMDRRSGRYLVLLHKQDARGVKENRVYYFNGPRLTIFDGNRDEYLLRTIPARSSVGAILVNDFRLEPAILFAVDPNAADQILFPNLRKIGDWRFGRSQGEISIAHRSVNSGKAVVIDGAFSANSMLPLRFYYGNGALGDSSTFDYRNGSTSFSFSVPSGARRVERFTSTPVPSRYQSKAAASVSDACLDAYARLRWLVYKAVGGGESNVVYWHGVQARQVGGSIAWAYDGAVLTIRDFKSRKYVRVACEPEKISNYLSPLGARIEPSLQSLMEGDNPLLTLYNQKMNVRLVGDVSSEGVAYSILEARNPAVRIQVRIRKDNHLVGGFISENTEPTGHVLTSSERTFTYSSVNKPFSESVFTVR